eukprot:TRINITY_DN4271_c1_g2_i1.p1 TRINITY_DN4271_c1_g2~~TRINITY_DN4271_c1_g2_i1.p1  ORF type:complete len:1720 (+),score=369.34 TRINITY_DN4271_c1_g2_i1:60-5219(+)
MKRKVVMEEVSEDEKVERLSKLGSASDQKKAVAEIRKETWVDQVLTNGFLCATGHGWELEHKVLTRVRWLKFLEESSVQRIASPEIISSIFEYCSDASQNKEGLDLEAWGLLFYRFTVAHEPSCPSADLGTPFQKILQHFLIPYKQQAMLPVQRLVRTESFGDLLWLYNSPLTLLFEIFQEDGKITNGSFEKLCKEFELIPTLSVATVQRLLTEATRDTNQCITSIKHLASVLYTVAMEIIDPSKVPSALTPIARLEHLIREYFSPLKGLGKTLFLPEVTTAIIPTPTVTTITPTRVHHEGGTCTVTGFNLGILQLGLYVSIQWGPNIPPAYIQFPDLDTCESLKMEIPPAPADMHFEGLYVNSEIVSQERIVVSFTSLLVVAVTVHNSEEAIARRQYLDGGTVTLEIAKKLGDTTLGPQMSAFVLSLFKAACSEGVNFMTFEEWQMVSAKFNIPSFQNQPFHAICDASTKTLTFKQFVSVLGHIARLNNNTADLSEVLNSWFTPGQTSKLYDAAVNSFTSTKRKSITPMPEEESVDDHSLSTPAEGTALLPDLMLSKLRRASSVLARIKSDIDDSTPEASPEASPLSRSQTFRTQAQLNELHALLEVLALEVSDINSSDTSLQAQLMKTREEVKHITKSSRSKDDALRRTQNQKAIQLDNAKKGIASLTETIDARNEMLKDWNACCKEVMSDLHQMEQWCDMYMSQSVQENPNQRNTALADKYLGCIKNVAEMGKTKIRNLSRATVTATGERRQTRAAVAQGEEYVKLYDSIREDIRVYGEKLLQQVKEEREKAQKEMTKQRNADLAQCEQRMQNKMLELQQNANANVESCKRKVGELEAAVRKTKGELRDVIEAKELLTEKLLHTEKQYHDEKETRQIESKVRAQRLKDKADQSSVPAVTVQKLRTELTETRAHVKKLTESLEVRSVEAHVANVELTTSDALRLKTEIKCDELKMKVDEQSKELKLLRQLVTPSKDQKKRRKSKKIRSASVSPAYSAAPSDDESSSRKGSGIRRGSEGRCLSPILRPSSFDSGFSCLQPSFDTQTLEIERKENAVLRRLLQSRVGFDSCSELSEENLKQVLQELVRDEQQPASRASSSSLLNPEDSLNGEPPGGAALLRSIIKNTMKELKPPQSPAIKEEKPLEKKVGTLVFEIKGGTKQLGINWRGDGEGFTVADVVPRSLASEVGILRGMKLLGVNGKKVTGTTGLQRAINSLAANPSTWEFSAHLEEVEAISPLLTATQSPFPEALHTDASATSKKTFLKALRAVLKQVRRMKAEMKSIPHLVRTQTISVKEFLKNLLNQLKLSDFTGFSAPSPGLDNTIPQIPGNLVTSGNLSADFENSPKGSLRRSDVYEKVRTVVGEQAKSIEAIVRSEEKARQCETQSKISLVGSRVLLRKCNNNTAGSLYYANRVKSFEVEVEKWSLAKRDARQKLTDLLLSQEHALQGMVVSGYKSAHIEDTGYDMKHDALEGLKKMSEWVSPSSVQQAVQGLETKNKGLQEQVAFLTKQLCVAETSASLTRKDSNLLPTKVALPRDNLDNVLQGEAVLDVVPTIRRSSLESSACMELVRELKAQRVKKQETVPQKVVRRRLVVGEVEEKKEAIQPKVPAVKIPVVRSRPPVKQVVQELEDINVVFCKLTGAPIPSPKQGFKAPVRKPVRVAPTVYEPMLSQHSPQNAFKLLNYTPPTVRKPVVTDRRVNTMNRLIRDEIAFRQARTV